MAPHVARVECTLLKAGTTTILLPVATVLLPIGDRNGTSLPTIMQPTAQTSPIYPHTVPSKIRRFSGLFKQSIRRCTSFTSSSVDTSAKSSAGGMVAMFCRQASTKIESARS